MWNHPLRVAPQLHPSGSAARSDDWRYFWMNTSDAVPREAAEEAAPALLTERSLLAVYKQEF